MTVTGAAFEYSYDMTEKLEQLREMVDPAYRDYINEIIEWNRTNSDDLTDYLSNGTSAGVYLVTRGATQQSIANTTATAMIFDTEELAAGAGASWVVGTPDRITISTAGVYLITAGALFAANGTGVRDVEIQKGAASFTPAARNTGAASASISNGVAVSRIASLIAGDYLKLWVWQSSGGALNATGFMQVEYLGVP